MSVEPAPVAPSAPILGRQPSSAARAGLNSGTFEFRTWLPRRRTESGVTADMFSLSLLAPACDPNRRLFYGISSGETSREAFFSHAPGNEDGALAHVLARYRFLPKGHNQNLSAVAGSLEVAKQIASLRLERLSSNFRAGFKDILLAMLAKHRSPSDVVALAMLRNEELLIQRPFLIGQLFADYPWLNLLTAWQDFGHGRAKYCYLRADPMRVTFAEIC